MNLKPLLGTALILAAPPLFADMLSVQPNATNVNVGDTASLTVQITGATDLYGYQFDIGFDPSILAANAVSEGAFLASGGSTTFLPGFIDNVAGTITFIADTLNGAATGVNGNGILVDLGFTAIGAGSSAVNIFNVIALNSFGEGLTVTTAGAAVNVANAAVPEPSMMALLISAMALGFLASRRRWSQN